MTGVYIERPPTLCGVYHLIRADRVVYVGQTTNVLNRIGSHASAIEFDVVQFYPYPVDELNDREREDLARLRPELNVEGVTRPYRVAAGQTAAKRSYEERVARGGLA